MGAGLCPVDRADLHGALLEESGAHGRSARGLHLWVRTPSCCEEGPWEQHEERVQQREPKLSRSRAARPQAAAEIHSLQRTNSAKVLARRGTIPGLGAKARGEALPSSGCGWAFWRPVLMVALMATTLVMSAYFELWHGEAAGPSWESALSFGSIPIIAAIIGYVTNVAALVMMFYPIEFKGFFPSLRIGCGLDLPLFGWQGVIPMKARQMAEISVDLMTQRLIKVEEIFDKMDATKVAAEVQDLLPDILSEVISQAGRTHCPRLWEHIPVGVHKQIEERVCADSALMMTRFVEDLQRNINDVFDLKSCAVESLVASPNVLNDIFLVCGADEFDFIRTSGFYLGFMFGILQMLVWLFCRQWWILPLCGVLVGYYTNVIALSVIFKPIYPRRLCCGLCKLQGLFLQRQTEVSALYGEQIASALLTPDVLMDAMVSGPKHPALRKLLSKHVSRCMEDHTALFKGFFLVTNGAENWSDLRDGVCEGFWEQMPRLLDAIKKYMWEAIELEKTLRSRLETLPAKDFERLLHSVFERDEIKLILVGALLGALVGMLQAMVQTPGQLGLPPLL